MMDLYAKPFMGATTEEVSELNYIFVYNSTLYALSSTELEGWSLLNKYNKTLPLPVKNWIIHVQSEWEKTNGLSDDDMWREMLLFVSAN